MCVGIYNEWTLLYVNQLHLCVRGTHSVSLRLFSPLESRYQYEALWFYKNKAVSLGQSCSTRIVIPDCFT